MKHLIVAALVILLVCFTLSFAVPAPKGGGEMKFVGFSNPTVSGFFGLGELAAVCQADFGPGARMATTLEVVKNPIPITNGIGTGAFVQLTIADVSTNSIGTAHFLTDVAGKVMLASSGGVGCYQGTITMIVTPTLRFGSDVCATDRQVACSAPQ